MGFGDWYGSQSDASKAALLSGIFNVGGSVLGTVGASKTAEAQRQTDQANALTQALLGLQNQRNDQNTFWPGLTQKGSGAAAALFGDPLAIAAKRQAMAKQREFLFGGPGGTPQWIKPPSGSAVRMPDMPDFGGAKGFYTDQAMLQSELPYWQAISQMTGGKVSPSFMGTGYGATPAGFATGAMDKYSGAVQQDWANREKTSNDQINATQLAVQQALGQQPQQQQKKKTSFWKKLGKGLLMAAPIIAAPFTAGLSLPLAMAVQGGIGAASGALTGGGVKGALLGGALGAAGGAMPGGHLAAGATRAPIGGLSGALGMAGKAISSPKGLMSMGAGLLGGGNSNLAYGTNLALGKYAPSLNSWSSPTPTWQQGLGSQGVSAPDFGGYAPGQAPTGSNPWNINWQDPSKGMDQWGGYRNLFSPTTTKTIWG